MSDILKRLNERSKQTGADVQDKLAERRDFCAKELPRLAREAIDAMVETEFRSATIDYTEIALRDGNHAAWPLASWPPTELPRQVIEKYEVFLLDTGHVVSKTSYWSGGVDIEPYDPKRYELATLNANSIYYMLSELPGDATFRDTNLSKVPK